MPRPSQLLFFDDSNTIWWGVTIMKHFNIKLSPMPCYFLLLHVKYSPVCYNERSYNKRMLHPTVFINKIRMLQITQLLQRTRRNTIGRRSTRVFMTFRAFPLWLERQSSSLFSFVWFSYQFSSVNCVFCSENIFFILLYNFSYEPAQWNEKAGW